MLEVKSLTKVYRTAKREIRALDDVSLTAQNGEVLGLLGLNGSGKTTLIKMVTGLVIPTSGTIWLDGEQIQHPSPYVSMVAEGGRSLYWRFTVEENLQYLGALKGARANSVRDIVEAFDLTDIKNTLVGNLSTGQKQRVAMATARLGSPKVVVFDEPTNGLDLVWQEKCCMQIESIAGSLNVPVIVASHDLAMIGSICDRVAILDSGKLVALRSRAEMSGLFALRSFAVKVSGVLGDMSLSWLAEYEHSISHEDGVTTIYLTVKRNEELYGLFKCLESESLAVLEVSPAHTDIVAAYRYYIEKGQVGQEC